MKLDEEDVRRIAERVVDLLSVRGVPCASAHGTGSAFPDGRCPQTASTGLVDAATLAELLGVERNWVYAHAKQLGGIRLGGPRGRLRFDLQRISESPGIVRSAPNARRRAETCVAPHKPTGATRKPVHHPSYGLRSPLANDKMAGRRTNAPGPTPGDSPDARQP
jgi:hypothetical protein